MHQPAAARFTSSRLRPTRCIWSFLSVPLSTSVFGLTEPALSCCWTASACPCDDAPCGERLDRTVRVLGDVRTGRGCGAALSARHSTHRVDDDVGRAEDRGRCGACASGKRTDPRDELPERERLGQVVIHTDREAFDAVSGRARRREHDDARGGAIGHESATHVVAVDDGQVAIEHHDLVGVHRRVPERLFAVERDVDRHPFVAEATRDRVSESRFVLDDEDAHASMLPDVVYRGCHSRVDRRVTRGRLQASGASPGGADFGGGASAEPGEWGRWWQP